MSDSNKPHSRPSQEGAPARPEVFKPKRAVKKTEPPGKAGRRSISAAILEVIARQTAEDEQEARLEAKIRELLDRPAMTVALLSRLVGVPEATLRMSETSGRIDPAAHRKLLHVAWLWDKLAELMDPHSILGWLETPNEAFEGNAPIRLIELGDFVALDERLFHLESGTPT